MNLSIDDIIAATYTILGEARNEPVLGQRAVAHVIINRYLSPHYFKQDSIWGVCHAPLQFSMWNNSPDVNLESVMKIKMFNNNDPKFLRALAIFLSAITGLDDDPTKGADHYHTIAKPGYATTWPPSWADQSKLTVYIGAHKFYKLA